MPARADERHQVLPRDVGRRRVLQRVIVEPFVPHHIGIENNRHPASLVIDKGEWCHRAGRHAQDLHQQIWLAKAEAVAGKRLVQTLEVDMCTAERHDKEQTAFLVLEKQVLGVPAGELALQLGAFRHREDGGVLDRLGVDAEFGKAGEQIVSGNRHAAGTLGHGGYAVLAEPAWRAQPPGLVLPEAPKPLAPRQVCSYLRTAAPALANPAPLLHKTALTTMDAGVAQG